MPLFIGAIVAALLKVLFRYAVFKIFAKLILGTATAGVIYLFLSSTVKPFVDEMQQKIVEKKLLSFQRLAVQLLSNSST